MKTLNSPLLFLVLLGGFIWLAHYAYNEPRVIVAKNKQAGYSAYQRKQMDGLVFQIKHTEPVVLYRRELAELYDTKPEVR